MSYDTQRERQSRERSQHGPFVRTETEVKHNFERMSKVFFKLKSTAPEMIYHLQNGRSRVEVWTTTCIVTQFARQANCQWLVNPSNPELTGTSKFSYFPRGGPVPREAISSSTHRDWQPLGHVSSWGGMEVGNGMMYSVSVVDGLVHQYGGLPLQAACAWHRCRHGVLSSDKECCPVGGAVQTTGGNLEYETVVHTTPPFYKYTPNARDGLDKCYRSVRELTLREFQASSTNLRVAVPLLGSGARGFATSDASEIAATSSLEWLDQMDDDEGLNGTAALVFGLLESDDAQTLAKLIENGRSS